MKAKILLVEDDINVQRAIQLLLKELNCIVEIAVTGKEALKMIRKKIYDAILMDFNLPDMTGAEVSRQLRNMKGNNTDTLIIAITGHDNAYYKQKCFDAGINYFLAKPFSLEELKSAFIKLGIIKQT